MKKQKKLFVVRKFISAFSAKHAISLDRKTPVDDVWVDDEWKKRNINNLEPAIGFLTETEDDEDA